jgi:hypothetical protein
VKDRIDRLRANIAEIKKLATTADKKAAAEMRALARDMEKTVSEMERALARTERDPGS